MTANQIAYMSHLENVRSNRAREAEMYRDNTAKLSEQIRHNKADEVIRQVGSDRQQVYWQGTLSHYAKQDRETAYHNRQSENIQDSDSRRRFEASKYGSDRSYESSKYVSDNSLMGTKYASDNSRAASQYATDVNAQTSMHNASVAAEASKYGASVAANASRYATDSRFTSDVYNRQFNYDKLEWDKTGPFGVSVSNSASNWVTAIANAAKIGKWIFDSASD